MPTRARKAREEACRRDEAELRELLGEPPNWLKEFSKTHPEAGDEMSLTGTPYNRKGVKFEEGQPIKRGDPPELGANEYRRDKRIDDAAALKQRYAHLWGKRGYAKQIAHNEGLNVRTVQKYFKDHP